ncbi:MAG: hypothetical protein M3Q83_04045 [Pseudomonadota bacterium]|nr:hypothetical protein [Pseudomonadota bacterium]
MTDRDLVRLYWPTELRSAFDALFGIDDALAEIVATTSEPALGAIRLAWWREASERLDHGPPPPEPRLQAAATNLLPRGLSGAEIGALEGGWRRLLDPFPWDIKAAEAIWFRGCHLFTLAARLLGASDDAIEPAGGAWALIAAARRTGDAESRGMMLDQARILSATLHGRRFEKRLRPLTMLGALARRDCVRGQPFEPEATPGRAAALLSHRMFGALD